MLDVVFEGVSFLRCSLLVCIVVRFDLLVWKQVFHIYEVKQKNFRKNGEVIYHMSSV